MTYYVIQLFRQKNMLFDNQRSTLNESVRVKTIFRSSLHAIIILYY